MPFRFLHDAQEFLMKSYMVEVYWLHAIREFITGVYVFMSTGASNRLETWLEFDVFLLARESPSSILGHTTGVSLGGVRDVFPEAVGYTHLAHMLSCGRLVLAGTRYVYVRRIPLVYMP